MVSKKSQHCANENICLYFDTLILQRLVGFAVAMFNKNALRAQGCTFNYWEVMFDRAVGGKITLHIQTSINIFIEQDCLRVKEGRNSRKINMNLFIGWSPFTDLQDANHRLFALLPRTHQFALKLAFLISTEVKDSKVNSVSNNK